MSEHKQKILLFQISEELGNAPQLIDTSHMGFNVFKDLLELYKNYNQLLFI